MKTVTKSISLHEDLAEFAARDAEEGSFGNMSAYFSDLIRARRQAKIDADLRILAEAVKGAGPEPSDDEVVAPLRRIRRQMQKEKWRAA